MHTADATTADATADDLDPRRETRACTDLAGDEPLAGSAPERPVPWLLLEHPGPWSDVAARLDSVPLALRQRIGELGLRTGLIRRHGRRAGGGGATAAGAWAAGGAPTAVGDSGAAGAPSAASAGVTALLAVADRDHGQLRRLRLDRLEDALDLDLQALAAGAPVDGEASDEPVVLACTHGRIDPCCAARGRPLARALAAAHPQATWETTHVGGCRFAGNLVVLSRGVMLGRVDEADAVAAVDEVLAGRLPLGHVRGVAGWPQPAQVADLALRAVTGRRELDATRLLAVERDEDRARVRLGLDGTVHEATLIARPVGPRPTGHGRDTLLHLTRWHLASLS